MLSRKVQKYIKDHFFLFRMSFQRLGIFLNLLYAEGVHISSILWWDHCKVSEQCFSVGADTEIRRIQNICILRRNGGKMILISDKFWFMKIIKNMENESVKVHAGRGRCMQAMI